LDKGHLEPTIIKGTGGKPDKTRYDHRERLPGLGNTNVIKLKASILDLAE
jgi:hypothetical protein